MNILVTGGAGFIGSSIVDKLLVGGHNVVVVDNLSGGKKEFVNKKAGFYKIDLLSEDFAGILEQEKISHIIHHAAQIDVEKSFLDPSFDLRNNVLATVKLLDLCIKNDIKKIIYASSAAVYGEPDYLPVDEKHSVKAMSPYGISKHTPEHYLKIYNKSYNLNYTVLRYANVYGPRQDPLGEGGVISIFVDRMLKGKEPVIYGDGKQTRDFIYVDDIVAANIAALEAGGGELFNISSNSRVSINELQQIINEILHKDLRPVYKDGKEGDIKHSRLDNTKAGKILNWQPQYDLRSGLLRTVEYYTRKIGLDEVAAGSS